LTVEQVAELERFTAADDQKFAIAFEIDTVAITGQAAQLFVSIVELDAARVGDWIGNFDRDARIAARKSSALGAIGRKLLDFDPDRFARTAASRKGGPSSSRS